MRRILIVDHDKITMSVTCQILREEGYTVEETSTLDEARKKVAQSDFSVVVTDMSLPDANGSTIIRSLKKIRPLAEVVVMTSYATFDASVDSMRAGAVDYLLKPCERQQLIEAVQKASEKRELSRENIQLRGLNEMKDKFLTLVSHELRTPLTLIYGYLTILQRQSAAFSLDQVDLINIIIRSSKQLIGIVNNIQTISQADSGEMKLHIQPVFPRKLLSDVLSETKASLTDRKLTLLLEEGEELPAFGGDAMRLHQIIAELIQNAVRNTKDGGEIILGTRLEADTVVLWVKDNGIGIPEDEQSKVFESFYEVADVKQHTSSTSRFGGGGIGIGLSLVKRVVEAHTGSIRLDSAPGKGTCVTINLPNKYEPPKPEFQDKLLA